MQMNKHKFVGKICEWAGEGSEDKYLKLRQSKMCDGKKLLYIYQGN